MRNNFTLVLREISNRVGEFRVLAVREVEPPVIQAFSSVPLKSKSEDKGNILLVLQLGISCFSTEFCFFRILLAIIDVYEP